MSELPGTPSDDAPEVLATGRGDASALFLSLTARHPDGRDAEYLRWHALDHRPEQHRLAGVRGSLRFVSTPACRGARAAADERYDAVDHVMAYLFADATTLDPFFALGRALHRAGRMPIRLPPVAAGLHEVVGRAAAPRTRVGADVVPWRPCLGAHLLVERGARGAHELVAVDGVAGAWWATAADDPGIQVTLCFLDDDPVTVAGRLQPVLDRRWSADGGPSALLAAPFHTAVAPDWDRHLP